jgi:hypothetical protein
MAMEMVVLMVMTRFLDYERALAGHLKALLCVAAPSNVPGHLQLTHPA